MAIQCKSVKPELPKLKVQNVLWATDVFQYSAATLPFVRALVQPPDGRVYGVHVLSPEAYILAAEGWVSATEQQEEQRRLDAEWFERQLKGVPHEVMSPLGDIADVIFRLAHERAIDLLVLGSHGRSGLAKLVLGSVAEKIFRHSPIPALTVGPHVAEPKKPVAEFKRVVFATDFSEPSEAALPLALSFAQQYQSEFFLLHVLQEARAGTVNFEEDMEFAKRRMKEMIPRNARSELQAQFFVEPGKAQTKVREFANKHSADLIVIGIHEPRHSVGMLTHFGHSLVQEIVAGAPCPVLTVRR